MCPPSSAILCKHYSSVPYWLCQYLALATTQNSWTKLFILEMPILCVEYRTSYTLVWKQLGITTLLPHKIIPSSKLKSLLWWNNGLSSVASQRFNYTGQPCCMCHFTLHKMASQSVCCLILAAVKGLEDTCSIEVVVFVETQIVTGNSGKGTWLRAPAFPWLSPLLYLIVYV